MSEQVGKWEAGARALCVNCGQDVTATYMDGEWFWCAPTGEAGCDWGELNHPCGGTYRAMDYHQPTRERS